MEHRPYPDPNPNPDPDPNANPNAHQVGELGSVRKHKVTGRVECLARWFIKASDHQVAMVGAGADAPYSLVYRIGGVTHDSWDYDWVDAETLTQTLSPKPNP